MMACAAPNPWSLDLKLMTLHKKYRLPKLTVEGLPDCVDSPSETKNWGDVRLKVADTVIHAHKSVLVATSDYFRAMFSGSFTEADSDEVVMTDIDPTALDQIVDAIYGGTLEITNKNIQVLLDAADRTEMKAVIEACDDYLTGAIRASNCLELLQLSEMYRLQALNVETASFMLSHFSAVTKHRLYSRIHSDSLITLICNDNVDLPEIDIFRAVLKWFKVHPSPEKTEVLYDVLKHVRLTHMTSSEIRDQVLKEPLITQNPDCMRMIAKSLAFVDIYEEKVYRRPLLEESNPEKPRGKLSVVVIVPEQKKFKPVAAPHLFLFGATSEGSLNMCDVNTFHSEATFETDTMNVLQMGNSLFFIGTKRQYGDDQELERREATLLRFNVQSGEWRTLAKPPFPALVFSASVTHKHSIYVFGGRVYQGPFRSDCYKYSIEDNIWSTITRPPYHFSFPTACSLGDKIYLVGGDVEPFGNKTNILVYDTTTNGWRHVEKIQIFRYVHTVCCVEGKIWMVGGKANMFDGNIICLISYDPENACIRVLGHKHTPFQSSFCHVMARGENIVILGGQNSKQKISTWVQTFNTRTEMWRVQPSQKYDQPHIRPMSNIQHLPLVCARMSCLTRSH